MFIKLRDKTKMRMNDKITKKYFEELDVIKGVAILLVIMGHSEYGLEIPTICKVFVQSYSMALFFIASGFLFSLTETWQSFFRKKLLRLVIPYLSFGLLTIAKRFFLSNYTESGSINLKDSLWGLLCGDYYWFLYVLFLFMVVVKIINNKYVLLGLGMASVLISLIYQTDSFIFTRIIHYPFYFICGFFLREHYERLSLIILNNAKAIGLSITLVFFLIMFLGDKFITTRIIYSQFIREIIGSLFIWNFCFACKQH